MTIDRIVLLVGALVYGAIGIYAMLFPQELAAVVYIAPDPATDPTGLPPTGATEIRAGYGGLGLSLGLFFLYCAWATRLVRPGLILLFMALLAAVVGRMVGIASDGAQEAYTWIMLFLEVAGTIAAAYLLLRKNENRHLEPEPRREALAPNPSPAAGAPTASTAPPEPTPAPPPSATPPEDRDEDDRPKL